MVSAGIKRHTPFFDHAFKLPHDVCFDSILASGPRAADFSDSILTRACCQGQKCRSRVCARNKRGLHGRPVAAASTASGAVRMKLPVFQLDAFTGNVFGGNPAVVVCVENCLADSTLAAIAVEHNISTTAFLRSTGEEFEIRYFMPIGELNLVGHASLAAAHVLLRLLRPDLRSATVRRRTGLLCLDLSEAGVGSVIWSTGYRYDYGWLKIQLLDGRGAPIQRRGVTSCLNVYFLGLHWMYSFKSAILAYVAGDAAYLADRIVTGR